MVETRYACPCCGHMTYLEEPIGTYDICPVCYWEDDPVQSNNPDYAGGANIVSLREAQQNFITYGYCEERVKGHVRKPTSDEPKDPEWKSVEESERFFRR